MNSAVATNSKVKVMAKEKAAPKPRRKAKKIPWSGMLFFIAFVAVAALSFSSNSYKVSKGSQQADTASKTVGGFGTNILGK